MKISIVIPVWNEEKYIRDCLDSIFALPDAPHEIIVVDNNSTDATPTILKEYDINVLYEKKQGITPARNTGYSAATGDIIARLDADSRPSHNWLDVIRKNFIEYPDIVGLAGLLKFYDSPTPESTAASQLYMKTAQLIYKHHVFMGPSHALRKDAWHKIKDHVCLDDNEVHEDIDLSLHISEVGSIRFDKDYITHSSIRRMKGNPKSFFIEYGLKHPKIIKKHKEIMKKRKRFPNLLSDS